MLRLTPNSLFQEALPGGVDGSVQSPHRRLIMARLPKGAATTISMAFLVMCAEKILRLLCLLFVAFYDWFCTWYRVGELWLAPESISPLELSESLVTV